MGYEAHPVFETPSVENATIWRYMSFSKFVRLMQRSQLYFPVLDQLEDIHEAILPWAYLLTWDPRIVAGFYQQRKVNAVNCWHLNENESALLWKAYGGYKEGIAIRSTFASLTKAFTDSDENNPSCGEPVHVGTVKYIDFKNTSKEQLDEIIKRPDNTYFPMQYKRVYFEHEQEVRAVLSPKPGGMLYAAFNQGANRGISVPVDLDVLIDTIYVAPAAEDWFYKLVKSLVPEKFAVERSGMDDMPPSIEGDASELLKGKFMYPPPP